MLSQKTQMAKRQFIIGDLAKELKVKKFVIRFWEKEFDLKDELSQEISAHAVQTDDDQDSRDCEFENEQEGELEQDDEIDCKNRLLEGCHAGLDPASRGSIKFEVDSGLRAGMTSKVVSDFSSAELAPEPVCAAQACELSVLIEKAELTALNNAQSDLEVSVYIQSEHQVAPQEQVIFEKIAQEATTVQAAQEICFPARALPDDSFYYGLEALKEQLLRLHELLN